MTKKETWEILARLMVVSGEMPDSLWNLSSADLSGADLRWADFSGVNFGGADLSGADLTSAQFGGSNLSEANLTNANLWGAVLGCVNFRETIFWDNGNYCTGGTISDDIANRVDLSGANLTRANLSGANAIEAILSRANLSDADLTGANLTRANLSDADLSRANLTGANLSDADLSYALLIKVNLEKAKLSGCQIYGVSAWDMRLQDTEQKNLIITPEGQPVITVDNLKVAQFIYLLLNNPEVREIIDTITSKVVLILGRFTPERKDILDTLRDELRRRNYTPVLFDFTAPKSRDITETISTLAHMAKFVIADITDAKSIPQELMVIVPHLPSVPVQPILQALSKEYGMFEHFKSYKWVLPIYEYSSIDDVISSISDKIISPAEAYLKK